MADEMTPMDSTALDAEQAAVPEETGAGKRTTNVAIIVGAILAFLVVAALVGAAVFVFVLGSGVDDVAIDPVVPAPVVTSTVDPALGTPVEPAPVALSTVFTFRDVFDPLIKPLPEESTATSPDGTTAPDGTTDPDGTTSYPEGTLVLQDLQPTDDGYSAVVVWNGETYTLAPGDRIPDSPWQLQSASATEAVLLYGDIRVTLSIGSRVIK